MSPAQRGAPGLGTNPGLPLCHVLPACLENARDAEEAEVRDHHLPVVIENIFGLEVLVKDPLGMQVPHPLGQNGEKKKRTEQEAQTKRITPEKGQPHGCSLIN